MRRPNSRHGRRGVSAPVRLPGAHRVVKRLARGGVAIYWYRRRGGQLMKRFEGASLLMALRAEAASAGELAAIYATRPTTPEAAVMTVGAIVTRYKAAPDGFAGLAGSTQAQWTRWLDRIRDEFGDLPASALKARGARRAFIDWRDRWAATPRTADYGMQVLKRVLAFAVERELADVNPAEGIKGLYTSDRADEIVEPGELIAILEHCTPALAAAIRLAAATGLRRGDLVRVRWGDVSEFSIELATRKGRRSRRRVIVPLLADARAAVVQLRRVRDTAKRPSVFLLTTATGRPWSEHWLTESWIEAARSAGVDKHLHDLRGTAATAFILGGLTDEQTAEILGWDPGRVTRIRRRYVDRERIARGVIAKLEREAK